MLKSIFGNVGIGFLLIIGVIGLIIYVSFEWLLAPYLAISVICLFLKDLFPGKKGSTTDSLDCLLSYFFNTSIKLVLIGIFGSSIMLITFIILPAANTMLRVQDPSIVGKILWIAVMSPCEAAWLIFGWVNYQAMCGERGFIRGFYRAIKGVY